MLKEHLPKGVFRHADDYELVHGYKPGAPAAGAGAGAGGVGAGAGGAVSARGLPSGGPAGVSFGATSGFGKPAETRNYGMKGAHHLGSISRY